MIGTTCAPSHHQIWLNRSVVDCAEDRNRVYGGMLPILHALSLFCCSVDRVITIQRTSDIESLCERKTKPRPLTAVGCCHGKHMPILSTKRTIVTLTLSLGHHLHEGFHVKARDAFSQPAVEVSLCM